MTVYWALAIIGVLMLLTFKISGSFWKALVTSVLGGVGSLCAVCAIGYFVPLSLGLNPFTLLCASVLSVPGVILMLAVKSIIIS